jgi:hypothetical protein
MSSNKHQKKKRSFTFSTTDSSFIFTCCSAFEAGFASNVVDYSFYFSFQVKEMLFKQAFNITEIATRAWTCKKLLWILKLLQH